MGVQWDIFKASNQNQVTQQPFITLIFDFIKGQLPWFNEQTSNRFDKHHYYTTCFEKNHLKRTTKAVQAVILPV